MTRKEVREFIESGVNALTPVLEFMCCRVEEFNWKADKTLPQVWQELREVSGSNPSNQAPVDDWNIVLHIVKQDQDGSIADEYNSLIDDCDLVAQQLMAQYNAIVSGYKLVTISRRQRSPEVHKGAHCMTGVVLSFILTAPDKTEVCP